MREFIAALRQLRRPIVLIAAAILIVQTLVAGLATAQAAGRLMGGGTGVLCHGAPDDGTAPQEPAAHDCCVFCSAAGPSALPPACIVLIRLAVARITERLLPPGDSSRLPRAIRAGPSQAPPFVS